jgi:uncharacterized protein (TIGR02328 family)
MRLWHVDLLPKLPYNQLIGQHRECCALRGLGWNKPHSIVNYVFNYSPHKLYQYHLKVITELKKRKPGINIDPLWLDRMDYRGKRCQPWKLPFKLDFTNYPEHNNDYYLECVQNLRNKGILIN